MKNFDLFVGIDWSGAKTPIKTKAIAVALAWKGREAPHISGKIWSREMVGDWIKSLATRDKRILIGIDCNFGYSQIIGEQQFGAYYTYADLWEAVEAANQNAPNYFAGGYWTHPNHQKYFWTQGKKPDDFDMPKRLTEILCGEAGYGWPESPFKLIGAKQVGKGGLAGMRLAYDLKQHCGVDICIWPFETHADSARIVITEIYPRQFLRRTGWGNQKVRTIEDINACLPKLNSNPIEGHIDVSDHETDALIAAAGLRFLCGQGKTVPKEIYAPKALDRITASREGWIFGV